MSRVQALAAGSLVESTIEDVAKAAGVSTATVSRALRGRPNVAPETRERVRRAAEELRYVANLNASRLASGTARTIGLIAPHLTSWYTSEVIAGVEEVLAGEGFDLLISTAGVDVTETMADGRSPLHQRVDGTILVDVHCGEEGAVAISRWQQPAVVLGEHLRSLASIAIDNVAGGELAGRYLARLGHRHIALVSGHLSRDFAHDVALDRTRGFVAALAAAGVGFDREIMLDGDFTIDGGYRATCALLDRPSPPTAIFLISDEMAFGALRAVRERGLTLGKTVSIMGFDDHPVSASIGLSTVKQPVRELGRVGAMSMLDRVLRRDTITRFAPELSLMPRTSTGPVGG